MQYRFGDYMLDVARRELRHGGEPIAIEPQVFDLLAYLIQNRDRVVTKDDLLGSVWGGRIVSEVDADQPDQCGAPGDRRYWIRHRGSFGHRPARGSASWRKWWMRSRISRRACRRRETARPSP